MPSTSKKKKDPWITPLIKLGYKGAVSREKIFKFFREKYHLQHNIGPNFSCTVYIMNEKTLWFKENKKPVYAFNHHHITKKNGDELFFETYEHAEAECIKYMIKLAAATRLKSIKLSSYNVKKNDTKRIFS